MCARTDADVGHAAPVAAVVAGMMSRKGEIADFVMLIAGREKCVAQKTEVAHATVFADLADLAPAAHLPEGGALLVGEMIGGEMGDVETDGLLKVALPAFGRFAGKAVDEVDADFAYAVLTQKLDSMDGLLRIVPAANETQRVIVERLYAHADAWLAERRHGRPYAIDPLGRDVVGVCLDGQLGQGAELERGGRRGDEAAEQGGGELRRRATTDVKCLYLRALKIISSSLHLPTRCFHVCFGLVQKGGGVEVAVTATTLAEGDVNVNARHGCKDSDKNEE